MIDEIIHGDCLEVMPSIPDKSIDMILCDLPYGTTACKWDTIIPFEPLWKQYERVIKDNGAIVLTASQPFTSALVMSNPKLFRYEWVWEKDRATGFLDAKKRPMRAHENICVFYKSLPTYNPQKTKGHKPTNKPQKDALGNLEELLRGGLRAGNGGGQTDRYPRDVIKVNMPNHGEMGLHPTQKPVALFEYLIKTYTNKGETVLDNCIGSGTTAIAAYNTNRHYIGIEKEEKCVNIARERIRQHTQQMSIERLLQEV